MEEKKSICREFNVKGKTSNFKPSLSGSNFYFNFDRVININYKLYRHFECLLEEVIKRKKKIMEKQKWRNLM
jgi:hypothetical protein